MLAIRLTRTGSKKRPHFRLVVLDSTQARDSRVVEVLGHYNPRTRPATFEVSRERVAHWLGRGAMPSDSVRTLLARHVTSKPAERTPAESAGPAAPEVRTP
jgi:small subunit ribosomal protein S16